jgi:hypothetical protein
MKYIIIFLVYQFINNIIHALYLTPNQYNLVLKIIKNPETSEKERYIINNILYKSYENWAVNKAIKFKNLHAYKCSNIKISDLILYSKYGLYKSIINYKGHIPFTNYSSIYINSELCKTITDHFSLSSLPKYLRKQSKANMNQEQRKVYKKQLYTIINLDNWQLEKYNLKQNKNLMSEKMLENIIQQQEFQIIWNIINTNLDIFSKRVMNYKYNFYFNKLRSNKHIAELMCCSEETIRINLLRSKETLKNIREKEDIE